MPIQPPSLGTVLFLKEWDWRAAERSLRRAIKISPGHPEALVQYGSLMGAGAYDLEK